MPVERHFLGWDEPVTVKVRDFLLPRKLSGPVDLEKMLVVVPTRQAARRLRQTLAQRCSEEGSALLSLRVVSPAVLLRTAPGATREAQPSLVSAIWTSLLRGIKLADYASLFPARVIDQDFFWALRTGSQLQGVREALVDGGYLMRDVVARHGSELVEPGRWQDLARLESRYLEEIGRLGYRDPCEAKLAYATAPELPAGIERVVLAAVPDPSRLAVSALEKIAGRASVDVLIHAPESLRDRFDEWGRPIAEAWRETNVEIPDARENIVLAGSYASQGRKIISLIEQEAGRFSPADMAIGVPDADVSPFVAMHLEEHGLRAYDPAGSAVTRHPLFQLLDVYRALVIEGNYESVSRILRHADLLGVLEQLHGVKPDRLLETLDRFQNEHLPAGLDDMLSHFPEAKDGHETEKVYDGLGSALRYLKREIEMFKNAPLREAVTSLFQKTYEARTIRPDIPEDRDFIDVARIMVKAANELTASLDAVRFSPAEAIELLVDLLKKEIFYPERNDAVVDLEGWLELPWNDAPFLVVTGMNDGRVPDGRLSDAFLPDSLRQQLGLKSDADRLTRDVFLMTTLIESRRKHGRVCFIAGKTGQDGTPMRPSRLLFRCPDAELRSRAEQLFGAPEERRAYLPFSISFKLDARPPRDFPADALDVRSLHVTSFRDYLVCPFRFYLGRVLAMASQSDDKRELEPSDFGNLVHHALLQMGRDPQMAYCDKPEVLQGFLAGQARSWVRQRFGPSPPLQVSIQLDASIRRLASMAVAHADILKEGWEIIAVEREVRGEIGGIRVSGRIDRIERHRGDGRLRIVDYKTSDKALDPGKEHVAPPNDEMRDYAAVTVGGKVRRWKDLQLPLYALLMKTDSDFGPPAEAGYFNLPASATDTGLVVWEDLHPALLDAAASCAEGVVQDLKHYRFWPPAAQVKYDDFEDLFYREADACFDGAAFELYLKTRAGGR